MHLTYVHRSHEPGGHLPHIPPVFFRYLSRMFLPDDVVVATRRTDMLLEDKNAVIYGGGGAVGGAVARAFAREGATVHLAGRTQVTLDTVAGGIRESGGTVATAVVDAGDEQAVEAHIATVVATGGRIDVLFNAIGMADVQGAPLVELPLDAFVQPVEIATRTQFL